MIYEFYKIMNRKNILSFLFLLFIVTVILSFCGCQTIEYTFHSFKLDEEPENFIEISEEQMQQFPNLKKAIQSNSHKNAPKEEYNEVRKLLEDTRYIKYLDEFYETKFSTNSKYF